MSTRASALPGLLRRTAFFELHLSNAREIFGNPRTVSSFAGVPTSLSIEEDDRAADRSEDLLSRIFKLRYPKKSATAVLEKWMEEGKSINASKLRRIAKELRLRRRYKHALEIFSWIESQNRFHMSPSDQATKLYLITRIHNTATAEVFYDKLSGAASQKAVALPLLHHFVKQRDLSKAESLMSKLRNQGLDTNPHLFNEMMKLYSATGEPGKVGDVISYMTLNNVPLNVLSYNLWINSLAEARNRALIQKVHEKMARDKNVELGWSTYCTLAIAYMKCGLPSKASSMLIMAEEKISLRKRIAHLFILTLYAALNDRENMLRLWDSSKRVPGRITCANYISVMVCFVKIGDIGEAEEIFGEWELKRRNYDIRVVNVLLGAYARKGWMKKAEALLRSAEGKGGVPNYKTWEIMTEGWLSLKEAEKASEAMKAGLAAARSCMWKPCEKLKMRMLKCLLEKEKVFEAKEYLIVLEGSGLMSSDLYECFIGLLSNRHKS